MEITAFLDIEKKYKLYEDTIEGIHYWNYSRFGIWHNYILKQNLELGTAQNQYQRSGIDKFKNYAELFWNSASLGFGKITQKDVCIINHPRKILIDGKYECVYTDKLAQKLSNCITLERPYQMQHLKPQLLENTQYLDILSVEKMVYYKWFTLACKNKYKSMLQVIERKIEVPLKEIQERYKIQLDIGYIVRYIAEQIVFYKASIKTVKKIVKNVKPKVLLEVVSYSLDCMMFTEVCKKTDIPVIELQHGILTNHMAYNLNTDKKVEQIPDKILLFSDYWKKHMCWPGPKENMISVGYPYFERQVKATKIIEEFKDKKNIIFISQGTIGKKLSKLARELAEKMDGEKYRILYKLHPGEYAIWQEQYPELKHNNIVILYDNKYALYDCFASSTAQVGVYSTALYEGLGFGLSTYIYEMDIAKNMRDLCQSGYAKYVKDAEELCSYMEQENIRKVEEDFWKSEALEHMTSVVLKEIENSRQ